MSHAYGAIIGAFSGGNDSQHIPTEFLTMARSNVRSPLNFKGALSSLFALYGNEQLQARSKPFHLRDILPLALEAARHEPSVEYSWRIADFVMRCSAGEGSTLKAEFINTCLEIAEHASETEPLIGWRIAQTVEERMKPFLYSPSQPAQTRELREKCEQTSNALERYAIESLDYRFREGPFTREGNGQRLSLAVLLQASPLVSVLKEIKPALAWEVAIDTIAAYSGARDITKLPPQPIDQALCIYESYITRKLSIAEAETDPRTRAEKLKELHLRTQRAQEASKRIGWRRHENLDCVLQQIPVERPREPKKLRPDYLKVVSLPSPSSTTGS